MRKWIEITVIQISIILLHIKVSLYLFHWIKLLKTIDYFLEKNMLLFLYRSYELVLRTQSVY